jgi:hypothetical protein
MSNDNDKVRGDDLPMKCRASQPKARSATRSTAEAERRLERME